jgi:hypothetical protein
LFFLHQVSIPFSLVCLSTTINLYSVQNAKANFLWDLTMRGAIQVVTRSHLFSRSFLRNSSKHSRPDKVICSDEVSPKYPGNIPLKELLQKFVCIHSEGKFKRQAMNKNAEQLELLLIRLACFHPSIYLSHIQLVFGNIYSQWRPSISIAIRLQFQNSCFSVREYKREPLWARFKSINQSHLKENCQSFFYR